MSIFLMGVYDPSTYRWCTVTKCGNGLDDKTINRLQRELIVKKISRVRVYAASPACIVGVLPSAEFSYIFGAQFITLCIVSLYFLYLLPFYTFWKVHSAYCTKGCKKIYSLQNPELTRLY